LSSLAFSNSMPIRGWARTGTLSDRSIFRGEIETRASRRRHTIRVRTRKPKFLGTSFATKGRLTSLMRAYRPFASLSSARNSRLSGQASGCTGHHRRHPSLVGARRVHSKVGAQNSRDRRATRATRLLGAKALPRGQYFLLRLAAIPSDDSTTLVVPLPGALIFPSQFPTQSFCNQNQPSPV
jgi:hypothetical protein